MARDGFVSSLRLLLPLSASFNAFFVWDILGNEVGWKQALGGLFAVLVVLPMLLWGGFKAGLGRSGDEDTPHDSSDDVEIVEMGDAFNDTFRQSDERYTVNPMSTLTEPITIPRLPSVHPSPNTDR